MKKTTTQWFGLLALALCASLACAQTNSSGAIAGTVTDPSGAVVPSVSVHLDQASTNIHLATTASSAGFFSFSNLTPGTFEISVEAKGFATIAQAVVVRIGTVTNVPVQLSLGTGTQTVEVTGAATAAQVDLTTATVSGIVGREQIANLPAIERNFLGLAQLEPGVQLIDGGYIDSTKNGTAGLSMQGAEGRTTEINVDGIDITDDMVGAPTQNVSDLDIYEFQVSQSSGDSSSDIGNTGQVNIYTNRGGNQYHGTGFAYYRGKRFAANPTLGNETPPFKQNQDGLALSGPLWSNHLYWFLSGERTYEDAKSAVEMPNFPNYSPANAGFFPTPGFQKYADARLDWQISPSIGVFYHFLNNDFQLVPPSTIGGESLSPYQNKNIGNTHIAALDWSTPRFTNEFRYGHLEMFNHITANAVPGVPPFPVDILFDTGETFGPNYLAPQHTFQINDEFKYSGSAFLGNHTIRYGVEFNHIAVDAYAAFFGQAPVVLPSYSGGLVGSDAENPEDYAPGAIIFGNGLGYASNLSVHGEPFGGFYNFRKAFYLADSWRALPNLTLNLGVHFERDPGEVNGDLAIPEVIQAGFPTLSHHPSVPNNWSPQIGIAWDPVGHGTTSIRLGAGMYYMNDIFNNTEFERANYISNSIANDTPLIYNGNPLYAADGTTCLFACPGSGQDLATQSIASLSSAMVAAETAYQASFAALTPNPLENPAILAGGDGTLSAGQPTPGTLAATPVIDDTYRTPYSIQMNFGIQHQFRPGLVVTANFVSNRALGLLYVQDMNDVSAARYLNQAVAIAAINGTAADLGVAQGTTAKETLDHIVAAVGTPCGAPACQDTQGHPQTLTAGMVNGLLVEGYNSNGTSIGAGINRTVGSSTFAFGGKNPNYSQMLTIHNAGMSNYHALQVKLNWQQGSLLRWIHASSLTVSYALGRLNGTQFDQSFAHLPIDNDNPRRFYGSEGYDRTQELSVGGIFHLPGGFLFSTVNHFSSGLSVDPVLASTTSSDPIEVFRTDWTGDGTTSDILPGSTLGAFNRSLSPKKLQAAIDHYNTNMAGTTTPAGQALITAGLADAADLETLGLTMPYAADVASGQLTPDSFLDTDIRIAKRFQITERFSISPQVEIFNLFNIGNYDPPNNVMDGTIATSMDPSTLGNGNAGSITDTTAKNHVNKFGLNTGVFAAGIPRAFQFGVRFEF